MTALYWKRMFYTPLYALLGVAFAGIVINPNYTSRHSFYLRKMTPVFCGVIGYQFGLTQDAKLQAKVLLKNYDYFPLKVKRTLQSKDWRHMADFDWEKDANKYFDPVSGKAL